MEKPVDLQGRRAANACDFLTNAAEVDEDLIAFRRRECSKPRTHEVSVDTSQNCLVYLNWVGQAVAGS